MDGTATEKAPSPAFHLPDRRNEGGSRTSLGRELWRAFAIVLSIIVSSELAHLCAIRADGGTITTIWPQHGLALGFLLAFGLRQWPAVLVGTLIALWRLGLHPYSLVIATLLDTFFPVLTVVLLDRVGFDRRLGRTRDALMLGLVAAAACTIIPSVLETMVIEWEGSRPVDGNTLRAFALQCWLESTMGVVVLTPPFLVVRPTELRRLPWARQLEGFLILVCTFVVTWWSSNLLPFSVRFGHALVLLVFPLLILAAFRFGKAGAALLALACAIGSVVGRAGTSTDAKMADINLMLVDQTSFLIIVSLFGMMLATMLLRRIGTELLLASTENSFRSLFEHSPIGIAVERGGSVRFINKALLRMLNVDRPESVIGHRSEDWMARGPTVGAGTERVSICRRADGTSMPVLVTETQIPQVDGVETVHFVTDLTMRQQLEAELNRARRLESVGLLASGIAHDFNNLLTVISGYVELVREVTPSRSDTAPALDHIAAATEKASALTRQLLSFGRQKESTVDKIDASVKVKEFGHILRRMIGEHVDLDFDLANDLPLIEVDPTHVDQIMLNLVANARDAIGTDGRVTIRTRFVSVARDPENRRSEWKPGNYVALDVTDTGSGMDEATLARVGEPFFTTKAAGHGSGIGLATVRGLVERLGGQFRIQSQIGRGTTVTVGFPAVTTETATTDSWRAVTPGVPSGATIIVVQDDPALRGLIAQVLHREGFRVFAVATASEALEMVTHGPEPCDLLVTDVMMPQMSGAELARCIRRRYPSFRALFISGYSEPELLTIRREGLLQDLLTKPFTTAQLLERVQSSLAAPI